MQPTNTSPSLRAYASATEVLSCARGGRRLNNATAKSADHLLSIVTVCYNSEKTISRTIDSIAAQTYPHIEYIVVDGGSTDRTVEILRSRQTDIDLWISERDHGISDAFNKGIALATGEYVALVNADDWLEPDHFRLAIEHLKRSDADFTFGNLMFHDHEGAPLYTLIGDALYASKILHAMPAINHPSIVCRRSLYERNGLFDKTFRIAMDYEWLLRNHKQGARGAYIPDITSHMGTNGISQRRVLASLKEVERASIRYGYSASRARIRYWIRTTKVTLRLFIERNVSLSLAISLRALINSRYQRR